jgi:hypothetical protein
MDFFKNAPHYNENDLKIFTCKEVKEAFQEVSWKSSWRKRRIKSVRKKPKSKESIKSEKKPRKKAAWKVN